MLFAKAAEKRGKLYPFRKGGREGFLEKPFSDHQADRFIEISGLRTESRRIIVDKTAWDHGNHIGQRAGMGGHLEKMMKKGCPKMVK